MGLGYGSQWGNREGAAEEQRLVGKGGTLWNRDGGGTNGANRGNRTGYINIMQQGILGETFLSHPDLGSVSSTRVHPSRASSGSLMWQAHQPPHLLATALQKIHKYT